MNMSVNITNLTVQLQAKIDALTGSEELKDLLIISKACEGVPVNRASLDTILSTKIAGFTGATTTKDLLVTSKSVPEASDKISIGGIARFSNILAPDIEVDGMKFIKNGFAVTSGWAPELDNLSSGAVWLPNQNVGVAETPNTLTSSAGVWLWAGGSVLRRSVNDGVSFSAVSPIISNITASKLRGTVAILVSSDGRVANSTNSGASFANRGEPLGGQPLNAVAINGAVAVIVGDTSQVGRSTNSGTSWSSISPVGFGGGLRAIDNNNTKFIAVGDSSTHILISTDNGATFTTQANPLAAQVTDIAYGGGNVWVMVTYSKIARSADNGVTWAVVTTTMGGTKLACDLAGVWIITQGLGSAAYRSYDNGVTWVTVSAGAVGNIRALAVNTVSKTWGVAGNTVASFARSVPAIGVSGLTNFDYLRYA
jgi:photosystem II stability/assembly factor-like uncharacterized protein